MRRLRVVLLQDLAILQPRYPSLPFFAHAPFYGPEWDEFALAVQSNAAGATEPQSLLVQRALPELSGVLESSREAVLQNSQRLASRLESRLTSEVRAVQDQLRDLRGSLDVILQGQVPLKTVTYYYGAGPAALAAPAPAPAGMPLASAPLAHGPSAALEPPAPLAPSMPVITALAKAFTVRDAWREWKEGIAG
jgi:hypothetical protein